MKKPEAPTKERPQVRTNRPPRNRYYGCVVLGLPQLALEPQLMFPFFLAFHLFFYLGLCVLCVDLWFEHLTYYWKIPLWMLA